VSGDIDQPYEGAWLGGTHHFALRVYFEDTDTAGIDQRAVLEANEGVYVVAEANIKYRGPAKLDDALVVLSEVREVRAASCLIHQRVMRGREVLADAMITAAFISAEGRPKRQPREWVAQFERLKREGA